LRKQTFRSSAGPRFAGHIISYIRLLIITMTERIMHSEKKHAEHIKQTRKMNNN